jgi:hypothetical protein
MPSSLHPGPPQPTVSARLGRAGRLLAGLLSRLPLVKEELDLLTDVRHQRTMRPRVTGVTG